MIGLVVVSHNAEAAEGIVGVTAQVDDGNARIVPVGGGGDGIGTSPDRIREGVEKADGGDRVVIPVDLGSIVIDTEFVTETTTDSEAVIADAPVLEGTLNATVETASKKMTLDPIVERAEDARNCRKLN